MGYDGETMASVRKSSYATSSRNDSPYYGDGSSGSHKHQAQPSISMRFLDSFKRNSSSHLTPGGSLGADGRVFDVEEAASSTAHSPLARKLKGRHLQMIAIGGSIGTGLFVGSASALANGGPASLLIAYGMIGVMMYCTVHALGEMAVLFPVAGSFSAYSTRFIDPAWGFAMGWNYALQWLVVLPLEIVAASLTVEYWNQGRVDPNVWVVIFLLLITGINLFGVKGYAEAEFVFSIIKVAAVIGFIILGIILNIGGGPNGEYIGTRYWRDPGAFSNGFKGVCSVFVTAAFAFAGTELVGLAAAETANPRKSLPTAVKQVFWRITLFYIVSLTLVGLLVPYTDPRLTGAKNSADAQASPFVIAITNAGIDGLPSVMNVVIMIAVISVGNSSVFGSSRTLAALAEQRQAPRILAYIDRKGRPIVAIGLASAVGLLAFLAGSNSQQIAFDWMIAISGLSSVFTWASICLAHIRFRKGWIAQGHTLSELAFRSQAGLFGSYLGLAINILILAAQFYVGVSPVRRPGSEPLSPTETAENFFQVYLAAPIVLVFYLPYKIWYRTSVVRSHSMDLVTGIRELNVAELVQEEREERRTWPRWKRVYKCFC